MKKGKLTKEQELLLFVLKKAIKGEKVDVYDGDLSSLDWKAFIKETFFQTVSYITFGNAPFIKNHISDDVYKKWSKMTMKLVARNWNMVSVQKRLVAKLGEDYKYIILKGLASAEYYINPELRNLGDVDFLIERSKQEEIKRLLIKDGYTCTGEDNDHHIVFKKQAAHLEMHFEIPGIPYGEIGEKIRLFMNGAFEDRVKISVETIGDFYVPDSMRHGLILLLHMQHHMLAEGLGLRHLMDWAFYVNKTHDEYFWQGLISFLKEIGLFVYAAAMTKTCAIYLDGFHPDWCDFISDDLCSDIIIDIFRLGNFGHKNLENSRSGALISEHGKDGVKGSRIKRLIQQFNDSVKSRHASLEKHKILYPFCAIFEFFRYMGDSARGKKPKLRKLMKYAKERKAIYERLHVFEVK